MREQRLADRLDRTVFDVVVVGGGVVGASAAQHLAAHGFSTLLVEQGDFASGTSSRSSRLLYCGLSYLAPDYPLWRLCFRPRDLFGRLRMARMSMHCRSQIVQTLPERVKPFEFVFPVQRGHGYSGWQVALGYRFLSLFASRAAPLCYRRTSAKRPENRRGLAARLAGAGLTQVVRFREYQYDWAERICVDTVLDAERLGARLLNYARVDSFTREGRQWRLALVDTLAGMPGQLSAAEPERVSVKARYLVNAAGPWADDLWARGEGGPPRRVVGIKGINLVVKLPDDCRGEGLETMNSLGQPFYVMPWGEHHFLGPTETRFEGDPAAARVHDDEIAFVLGEANRVFPDLRLSPEDVIYSWCGVRPATAASRPERLRALTLYEEQANEQDPPAITVTGAPIMVHRRAGREVARRVAKTIKPSGPARRLSYAAKPLADDQEPSIAGVSVAALRAAAAHEHVHTLSDLMFRRVNLGWQVGMGLDQAEAVARAVADVLGWDAQAIAVQIAAYRAAVVTHFAPRDVAEGADEHGPGK